MARERGTEERGKHDHSSEQRNYCSWELRDTENEIQKQKKPN